MTDGIFYININKAFYFGIESSSPNLIYPFKNKYIINFKKKGSVKSKLNTRKHTKNYSYQELKPI